MSILEISVKNEAYLDRSFTTPCRGRSESLEKVVFSPVAPSFGRVPPFNATQGVWRI